MSGVSVDLATAPPSQADQDLKLAYAGGDDFFSRLQDFEQFVHQAGEFFAGNVIVRPAELTMAVQDFGDSFLETFSSRHGVFPP